MDTIETGNVRIDLVGAFHGGGGCVFLAAGKQCGKSDRRSQRRTTKAMRHLAFQGKCLGHGRELQRKRGHGG
ncbi:hypothetical protein [Xanthomonas oryzae]|uniref:hypothetical protein n=1 Tax=Xanthomonas oryzae TaxID=347 RepID=UPI00131F3D0D|nr:hypothetical protein [Xanthomonas oryzae]